MLNIIDHIPDGFLDVSASELYQIIPQPSLIHLKGKQAQPLFISILLHGNEDVGLQAVQRLLKDYQEKMLPRSLIIFVGNVTAARKGRRRLDGQPDYNRVWPGADEMKHTEEARLMARVVDYVVTQQPFASIDLHNNTGVNPHYACINVLDSDFFHLARLFSRTVVYFLRPHGVQSLAMSKFCPSVTVECGRTGDESGVVHAAEFLHASLNLHAFPEHPISPHDIDLFHTVATVKVPQEYEIAFGEDSRADIVFRSDLDHLNFREVDMGTEIAQIRAGSGAKLHVIDESGREVERQFFCMDNNRLNLCSMVMPSMFTLNKEVIRQDCLGYLMERYPLPG